MSRTSIIQSNFRCPCCGKLLATPEGIKCPRCKEVHSYNDYFPKGLWPDQLTTTILWAPDGSQASSIVIRKEIWLNYGSHPKEGVPKDCLWYPVFFVYNYFDPSKAFAEDAGCRINKEPIFNFKRALSIAQQQEVEVIRSGKWVEAENVKEPEVTPPNDGVWSFRNLENYSKKEKVSFDDLCKTLQSYSKGASILSYVVISILKKIELTKEEYEVLEKIAKEGASGQRFEREKKEWLAVVRWLSEQVKSE